MTLPDFLRNAARLPKERKDGDDYPDYLSSTFTDFIAGLKTVTGSDSLGVTADIPKSIPTIQKIADEIVLIVRDYYSGSPHKAFKRLSDLLSLPQHSQFFDRLYTIKLDPNLFARLYRLRVQTPNEALKKFSRKEMFHLPFQLRHKVEAQRYSIPGFPSLYLGSSVYICWRELQCPQFDDVHSIRLEVTSSPMEINVLDFGWTPEMVATYIEIPTGGKITTQRHDFALSYVVFWPLIAAVSMRVLYRNHVAFKPEYIVPQLILQYVKEDSKIDGIRYFSLHYEERDDLFFELGCNFVFPVKQSAPTGHCPILSKKFKMTAALPWQIANRVRFPRGRGVPNNLIELVEGYSCGYNDTFFGDIESISQPMPLEHIPDPLP